MDQTTRSQFAKIIELLFLLLYFFDIIRAAQQMEGLILFHYTIRLYDIINFKSENKSFKEIRFGLFPYHGAQAINRGGLLR